MLLSSSDNWGYPMEKEGREAEEGACTTLLLFGSRGFVWLLGSLELSRILGLLGLFRVLGLVGLLEFCACVEVEVEVEVEIVSCLVGICFFLRFSGCVYDTKF